MAHSTDTVEESPISGRYDVAVISKLESDTPSVKNLYQGLQAVDWISNISIYQIDPPNLGGESKIISAIERSLLLIEYSRLSVSFRLGESPDIVIIHKTLSPEIVELLLGINIAERLFTASPRSYNIVYSTYDADYVTTPKVKYLFKNSDLVYATSKEIVQEATNQAPDSQVCYIPPSVDTDFFSPTTQVPECLHTDTLVIGWIGNASVHQNDIEIISNICQQLGDRDITLRLLLGGSSLPDKLTQKLVKSNVDTQIINSVSWEAVPKIINSLDIGLAPLQDTAFNRGRSSEKVREYMACGLPVIGSNIGENKELIPKNAGYLVNSVEEWVDAIDKLSDEQKREEMGKNAREYVCQTYSIPVIADRISDTFSDIDMKK